MIPEEPAEFRETGHLRMNFCVIRIMLYTKRISQKPFHQLACNAVPSIHHSVLKNVSDENNGLYDKFITPAVEFRLEKAKRPNNAVATQNGSHL